MPLAARCAGADLSEPLGRIDRSGRRGRRQRHFDPLIAQKLSESLEQQFYVENIVGAGGNIGMGQAMKAAPDGYTVLSVARAS